MNQPVRLISISQGADFEIDLSYFPEAEPVFAYVDDRGSGAVANRGSGAEVLYGLVEGGRLTIHDQPPFMWLDGPRDCILLKANAEARRDGRAAFRSPGVGEFCLEIYHVQPDGGAVLLHQADFCFK